MLKIFLDIDGVLNIDWKRKWKRESVDNLNSIYTFFLDKNIQIEYILTSTWRISNSLEKMNDIFKEQKVLGTIVGFTDLLENEDRGKEITKYISDNNINDYIVIDDVIEPIINYVDNEKIFEADFNYGIDKKLKDNIIKYLSQNL